MLVLRYKQVAFLPLYIQLKIIKNDFNEKQILKNTSDFFGQKNYEENIKQNFANSIARKFNLRLLTIK